MERDTYDEKLERILRQASAVFAEKGQHRASIRDIARATDVSLSGLYCYFSSKEELLFLIRRHCFDIILGRLRTDLDGVEAPDLRVATFSLFGMMNWIYNWHGPERDVGVDRLADEMLHLFLSGYRSAPVRAASREADESDTSLWT